MFKKIFTSEELSKKLCGYDFQEAVEIWRMKPQVANRRLAGSLQIFPNENTNNTIKYETSQIEICLQCILNRVTESADGGFKQWLLSHREDLMIQLSLILRFFCCEKDYLTDTRTLKFWTRKLLPRAVDRYLPTYELVLWKSGLRKNNICLQISSVFLIWFECNRIVFELGLF